MEIAIILLSFVMQKNQSNSNNWCNWHSTSMKGMLIRVGWKCWVWCKRTIGSRHLLIIRSWNVFRTWEVNSINFNFLNGCNIFKLLKCYVSSHSELWILRLGGFMLEDKISKAMHFIWWFSFFLFPVYLILKTEISLDKFAPK